METAWSGVSPTFGFVELKQGVFNPKMPNMLTQIHH